ncbi:hypothetical protein GCM10017783_25210 [Deinococcus piscis]|uniref:PD(D/E)XK endonuclease domain-containing protein n=1 Tax=Deinococcus piscis TaxID=394230 RepID=A0ABQ3KBN9_9DEIO|nr:hypothetical protein GCM10017783_25210 [Deinococcus piscis]
MWRRQALGGAAHPHTEWDAYDLVGPDNLKVEVKSAAYLQSWQQRQPSAIRFDIALKRGWDASTNIYSSEASRTAEVYVFCVFAEQRREFADPLQLEQWFFLVCPTQWLGERFSVQKSVALSTLEHLTKRCISFWRAKRVQNMGAGRRME